MPAATRRSLAALVALVLLFTAVSPAAATVSSAEAAKAPVVFDVLVMRPVGFVTLVLGASLFAVALPFIAVTRPTDIGKPFDQLVVKPAKFLWSDSLGSH